MAAPCRRIPLVVILGATGTGKSKLAIELGKRFNGEIISTDSMQIYKGLDIVTNKVTPQEQSECHHHMISYLSPLEYGHTVVQFRNKALPIIERLISEEKIPIIVGGTNYYIESLLWNFLVSKKDVQKARSANNDSENSVNESIDTSQGEKTPEYEEDENWGQKKVEDPSTAGIETTQLHKILQDKDPEMARKVHPHNRRKIVRALEVYNDYGVKVSDVYKAQHEDSGSNKRGMLRYPDPCLIWIQTQHDVLIKRLEKRVISMIEEGLIKELQDFHDEYTKSTLENNRKLDYECGIFQLIGLKEYKKYLMLSEEEKNADKGRELLKEGEELLNIATRQYARRQIRWIQNRLLKSPGMNVPPVYSVDSTEVDKWEEKVYKPAEKIVEAAIKGIKPDQAPEPYIEKETQYEYNICDICDGKVFVTKFEWESHLRCRKHYKRAAAKRKTEHRADNKRQKIAEEKKETQFS